ncbi:hypothetical protein K432DRAFT_360469 [Lepidopterella palustris CBS 459.81]|uniref:B30.2/SPRY domain-containing protein n=1 Tax=Lepidopterella palustris CBS 459.81 TaxID=1314670 RepID=A0A8E2JBX6_9PEZI|nr:hypothetical protein K432DRAFT_360469 [Lepidopterella palustris CBS 459.81]
MAVSDQTEGAPSFEKVNWDKARQMFKDGRKEKDDERKLEDFLKERCSIEAAKAACEATKQAASAEYSPALGGILAKIDIAMSVGDLAIKSAPESIGLAWMGIRLCLHSVADDFSTFSIFGAACSDIIGILISCAVYGRMYGAPRGPESFQEIHSQVCDRIPKIYSEILDFSFSVKKYMGRNKLIRVGKGLFAQASAKFSGKIKSIRDHEACMSEFARKASEQLGDYYNQKGQENQESMIETLSELRTKMEMSLKANEDCLNQLKFLLEERKTMKKMTPLDIALKNFEENEKQLNASSDQKEVFAAKLAKRSPPETCTWMFTQDEYLKWLDSRESSLLWVSGGGGFGKSILMSAIIEELQRQSIDKGTFVHYFFCSNGDDATKRTERILRHMIYQVYVLATDRSLDVIEKANKLVSNFLKKKSGSSKSQSSTTDKDSKKEELGFGEAYRGLVELLGKPVYVVIDALDECTDRQAEGLVSSIKDMVHEPGLGIKVLVCSRPDPSDLGTDLDNIPRIKVEDNNGPDIKLNAKTELNKLPGWAPWEREMACEKIVEKAGSYFRYVDLAVEFLKQPWQRPLKKHLEQLPEGLQAFYEQIIRKTDPAYMELLKTCLTWTILADGQIKVPEIMDAYSRTYTEDDESSFEEVTTPDTTSGEDLYVKQIRIAGSALLDVDTKSRVVQLRHTTVGDYFLSTKSKVTTPSLDTEQPCECENCMIKRRSSDRYELSEKHGHLAIATTILRHLNCESFRKKYLVPYEKQDVEGRRLSITDEVANADDEKDNNNEDDPKLAQADNPQSTPESTGEDAMKDAAVGGENMTGTESPDVDLRTDESSPSQGPRTEQNPGSPESEAKVNGTSHDSDVLPSFSKDAGTEEAEHAKEEHENPESDSGSDSDSDAGVDDGENTYTYEEPPDPSVNYRYEINHCRYHLTKVEELWDSEDRRCPEWEEFERLRDNFFQNDSRYFRSWVNLRRQTRYSEIYWVNDGLTVRPVHLAAAYGLTSLVAKLIERKTDLSVFTDEGYTPLAHAIEYCGSSDNKTNGIKLLKLLLEAGADPNLVHKARPYTPFCTLIFYNPPIEVVRLLLDYKADATWYEKRWKRNILHYIAGSCSDVDVLKALIAAGADPNWKDTWGETPLHTLMSRSDGSVDMLKALIEGGANVNAEDDSSQQPLYEVSMAGNLEAARVLIEKGADVMDDDLEKLTALHVACKSGHQEIVWLLIENGALITATDNRGRTPFYLACEAKSEETALSLIERLDSKDHGVFTQATLGGKTPLRKAAARGHKRIVQALFEKLGSNVADLIAQDTKSGQTPLHAAAYNGRKSVVEFLLNNNPSTGTIDRHGNTALKSCFEGWSDIRSEDYEAVSLLLLDFDPKAAAQDPDLLNTAAMRGSVPVITKLLDSGANPMRQDEHGWTSFQLARQYGRTEAAELLAKHRSVVGLRPSKFKSTLPKLIRISDDGTEVEHLTTANYHGASVISNHPIPAGTDGYYYEIEIVSPEKPEADNPPEVAFGLCHRPARLNKWLPGWCDPNPKVSSWAYHGDDAGMYSNPRGNSSPAYPSKYGHGDVMGCGIDFRKKSMFYTRNGELVLVTREGATPEKSYYAWGKVSGRLHPVLGMRDKVAVKANFGSDLEFRPFRWVPANEMRDFGIEAVEKAEEGLKSLPVMGVEDEKGVSVSVVELMEKRDENATGGAEIVVSVR